MFIGRTREEFFFVAAHTNQGSRVFSSLLNLSIPSKIIILTNLEISNYLDGITVSVFYCWNQTDRIEASADI